MTGFVLRPAGAADLEFLIDMLVQAVTADLSRAEVLADPRLRRYVDGWPRPGDGGLIALDPDSGHRLGALWWRLFPASAPGYGYVADDVPELSVALVPQARGRGAGRALLRAAKVEVGRSRPRLSLSVNRANHALALYVSEGFRKVGVEGTSDVMLAEL